MVSIVPDSLLVIIVTYNPDLQLLKKNILSLLDDGVTVYISDNDSKNIPDLQNTIDSMDNRNIVLELNKVNLGLANAQNKGILYALKKYFTYICFFDQDTVIPSEYANNMLREYKVAENEVYPSRIGMLAPNYYDYRLKEYAHFAKLTKHSYLDVSIEKQHFLNVSFVVSSGSFIKTEVVKKIGLLKGKYFIDQIDTEYSLRLLKNNYSIWVTSKVLLRHTIGNRDKKNLFGLTIKPNNHSALRKFYIFRNGIRTVKDYGVFFPGFRWLMFKRFIHDFLGVLFFEDNKKKKIKAMYYGLKIGKLSIDNWSENEFFE